MCLHLTHRITVLTVTMDSVQEVSAWREKQILNTLSLGCSDLGDDSTNCPSTHPNCNGGHVCEPPLDECQVDYDCNEALGLSGICEPGVPEQTQCWYCESDGGKKICKPGIQKNIMKRINNCLQAVSMMEFPTRLIVAPLGISAT